MKRPKEIVAEQLMGLDDDVMTELPVKRILETEAYQEQSKNRLQVRMSSLAELDVNALEKVKTRSGEKLLYYDSGYVAGTRYVIFATDSNLKLLSITVVASFDATFDVIFC